MKWTGDLPLYQYVYIKDDKESYEYVTELKNGTPPTKTFY
jgi:hypothetical protein